MQRWIWQRGWTDIHDIQERAIDAILDGESDLIIAAATAGGKTEAAFLPICSSISEMAGPGLRAIYVSPLKALINDQFGRLEDLCEELEIPVHKWHGDVGASLKKKVLAEPDGILLITPESLEAIFTIHGTKIGTVFREVRWAVIDELHCFIGGERGRQLQSILHRLETSVNRQVRRIGLSATLGEMRLACDYLRPNGGDAVQLIESKATGQEVRLQLRGYRHKTPQLMPCDGQLESAVSPSRTSAATPESPAAEIESEDDLAIADHLFATLRTRNNLVFANSRREVERFADLLRTLGERARVSNEFFPHHGSIAKDIREDVERRLKEGQQPTTAVCTSTLELGIDIGSVSSVAQVGSPFSVAAMRQRLGRSGRRGDPAVMRIYVREEELTPGIPLQDALRPELVQAIAMVRLLINKWYEPPTAGALHLSTLVQQILAVIAERGGTRATDSWHLLCRDGPFGGVDQRCYADLLRCMATCDLIAQTNDGTLLLGLAGERIVNHYSFFAVFRTPEEYRLVANGQEVGSLPVTHPVYPGAFIIFAGRRWEVVDVDEPRKVISLVAAAAGKAPLFTGDGGEIHDRVRQEMLAVYSSPDIPAYLDERARELLREGRAAFLEAGLASKPVISVGPDLLVFPWRGDRVMGTLALLLIDEEFKVSQDGVALLVVGAREDKLTAAFERIREASRPDPVALARKAANKVQQKYDEFLSDELLSRDFASRRLDVDGALASVREIFGE